MQATIKRVETLCGDDSSDTAQRTLKILLDMPDEFSHAAGQYLQIQLSDGVLLPLSIASSPRRFPELELHYRSTPGDAAAQAFDARLALHEASSVPITLEVTLAEGDCICPESSPPILIVAAGTGASQAFACIEHRSQQQKPTDFLWCVEQQQDLYYLDRLSADTNVQLTTKVDSARDENNAGMQWLAAADLSPYTAILLAGAPEFVYTATDVLLDRGVSRNILIADAYSYAPR